MHKLLNNKILYCLVIAALFIFGILARIYLLYKIDYISGDMEYWLIPWYDYINSNGILKALGDNFSNYTPPYTYLLSITTLMSIPKVMAIKLISVVMDFVNAFIFYKIVQIQYKSKLTSLLAASLFLCLPTICMNSTIWGQADAFYTGFLLISLYFLLKEQPFWGTLAFSISFAFKGQAIFIVPFLAVLFIRERIKLWYLLLVPSVYLIMNLPVILLGRNWIEVLTVYFRQGNTWWLLSSNAPNFYILIPNKYLQSGTRFGLVVAATCLGLWIFFTVKYNQFLDNKKLAQLAFISVALTPFLLPKMHDRYFYPADVFSLIVAFYWPQFWFLPILYQIISGLSSLLFLLHIPGAIHLLVATILNATTVIFLLRKQFYSQDLSIQQVTEKM